MSEQRESLAGRRILIASGGHAGARLAAAVRERGGIPFEHPLIETAPPQDPGALAAALERWNGGAFDWLAVTSANGAGAIEGARTDAGRFAAVGPATADVLRVRGVVDVLVPERAFTAEGLAEAMLAAFGSAPQRVLLPLSEIAGTALETELRGAGHEVTRVTAYRTQPTPLAAELERDVADGVLDAILVTSASIAREVARRFAPIPPGLLLAAIGEPSARALVERGLPAHVVASEHTASSLVAALGEAFANQSPIRTDSEGATP